MLEHSKWQKELYVFSKIVNTIVFTGNINDQYPVINEKEQKLQGFCSLDTYIGNICSRAGYQAILCYNPVVGFHMLRGIKSNVDILETLERLVSDIRNEEGEKNSQILRLTRHNSVNGCAIRTESVVDAARIINLLLTNCDVSLSLIVSFSSRMVARPDDLDTDERMIFMYLQEGATKAKRNHAGTPESVNFVRNPMIQNQLFLIADKLNDLPAWYYLAYPDVKNIDIPKPDYRIRSQIITNYAGKFPGYNESTEEEQNIFVDTFVGSTEGFTTQDLVRVFQIAQYNHLDIHGINKAIMLYKHGVQDNPWLQLDPNRLACAEDKIKKRVLGQDAVVKSAVDIIKRAAMGMSGLQHSSSTSKPRGILFLAGPTGTGKTELAKALTELVFLDERNMIRFDMSEYRQEQSDQRLLGAPPGYVGYEAGGQLTNAVREHPFSVLLFDEIEKAHPSVMDKFLQVLEDGRITDGRGETVYFQDCLIIFTSNLGITIPSPNNPTIRIKNISYEENQDYQTVHDKILNGVKHFFNEELGRPELLNRIGDNILVFDFIRKDSLRKIIRKQTDNIDRNLWVDKHIHLELTTQAEDDLFEFAVEALPLEQGGRGIGNMIEKMLINPLARFMFDNYVIRDSVITVEQIFEKDNIAYINADVKR